MTIDTLRSETWPDPQTDYEAETLAFCRSWQRGQTEFILHTSGSTGTPKPITLTRAQMRASAQLTGQALGLQAGNKALVCLNSRYVAGVMMLVRGLELGMTLTVQEPSGNPLSDFDPDQAQFDFTAFVPLQLQTILDTTPQKLPILNRMKAILVGGAATSPALEEALQRITAPVFATYGMTETVSHIALRRLNGPAKSDFFTALAGVQLGVDDRGCLHITAAASNFERVQTNDVVEFADSTHFRIVGRADTIINSGGVKVQPEQIEHIIAGILGEYALNQRIMVAGLADQRLGQRLVLLVETPAHEVSTQLQTAVSVAQDAIRQRIGRYAVPKDIGIVPTFVETATGKLDRRATVAAYLSKSAP
ncbi:AMP-binding protein [Spirosoma agri]|uniref:AMP-binding protein n=1 Tax=Spirosoma agri TaxID=1987381 RepID=A0A6M0IJX2_9BACT|nr:AMP-binding protein [Spirosoma agri]NEU68112.1 AMP-binding protein [Spirosoma agri]